MGILYLLLPYVLQGTAIVHCIKTGRNWLWIWVLIWPGIGAIAALAYVAIEILPDLFRSRTAQRTARGLKRAVDPFADLRRYENEARLAGNVAARQRYADELVRHGALRGSDRAVPAGAHRTLRARSQPHAGPVAGAVRQRRRGRGTRHARGAFPTQSGVSLAGGASSLRPRARGRGQHGQGAGAVPRVWPTPTRARRPRSGTRSCSTSRDSGTRPAKWPGTCSIRRASHPDTTGARSAPGSMPRSAWPVNAAWRPASDRVACA